MFVSVTEPVNVYATSINMETVIPNTEALKDEVRAIKRSPAFPGDVRRRLRDMFPERYDDSMPSYRKVSGYLNTEYADVQFNSDLRAVVNAYREEVANTQPV